MSRCAQRAVRREPSHSEDLSCLCDAGDLLPDWYDDWLVVERERLRQLRLGALEQLCHERSAHGDYARATEAAMAAIATEPLRESAHYALIGAHIAARNHCEALRQYGLFRSLLREQLGLEPSAQLGAMVDELRSVV